MTESRHDKALRHHYGLIAKIKPHGWEGMVPREYRDTYGVGTPIPVVRALGPLCAYWGEATGQTRNCPGRCGGKNAHVYSCAAQQAGVCTIFPSEDHDMPNCEQCTLSTRRAAKLSPPTVRHLLYHIYPLRGNGVWQWNIEQLRRRLSLFNGHKIIAVAVDDLTDTLSDVKAAIGTGVEIIVVNNNPDLREVATFRQLFDRIQTDDPTHVTFWAHSKGIQHGMSESNGTTPTLWAGMLYESLLDYWPLVSKLLCAFPVVGSFKKVGDAFSGSGSKWHYSGSFFWFRNAELFKRNWTWIVQHKWGIESYPSLHFRTDEAGCVFFERFNWDMDLYEWNYCQKVLQEFESWKTANKRYASVKA